MENSSKGSNEWFKSNPNLVFFLEAWSNHEKVNEKEYGDKSAQVGSNSEEEVLDNARHWKNALIRIFHSNWNMTRSINTKQPAILKRTNKVDHGQNWQEVSKGDKGL